MKADFTYYEIENNRVIKYAKVNDYRLGIFFAITTNNNLKNSCKNIYKNIYEPTEDVNEDYDIQICVTYNFSDLTSTSVNVHNENYFVDWLENGSLECIKNIFKKKTIGFEVNFNQYIKAIGHLHSITLYKDGYYYAIENKCLYKGIMFKERKEFGVIKEDTDYWVALLENRIEDGFCIDAEIIESNVARSLNIDISSIIDNKIDVFLINDIVKKKVRKTKSNAKYEYNNIKFLSEGYIYEIAFTPNILYKMEHNEYLITITEQEKSEIRKECAKYVLAGRNYKIILYVDDKLVLKEFKVIEQ